MKRNLMKSMKFKDIHLRMNHDLFSVIEEYAKSNKLSINETINRMIQKSILIDNLLGPTNEILSLLNKLSKDTYYIKQLLIQTYSDLDLEKKNPQESENLKHFNRNFKNRRMND